MRIERIAHRIAGPILGEIEVRHLTERVYARIRAPGTVDPNLLAAKSFERPFERRLHGRPVLLRLPAHKGRAVIFDCDPVAGHRSY